MKLAKISKDFSCLSAAKKNLKIFLSSPIEQQNNFCVKDTNFKTHLEHVHVNISLSDFYFVQTNIIFSAFSYFIFIG